MFCLIFAALGTNGELYLAEKAHETVPGHEGPEESALQHHPRPHEGLADGWESLPGRVS